MQVVSAAASTGRNVGSRLIARRWWGGSERGLWPVGLLYAVIQLVMVGPRLGLGPDELIYASQVYGGPRLQWTAPRSRGVPALIWPVVHLTTSVPALRWYLIALSGASLALAYRPWLRVRPGPVAPLAGLLFATLWIADFYGNAAMPNLWVALAAVASGGYFVRSGRETAAGTPLCGVAVAVGLLSMMRLGVVK